MGDLRLYVFKYHSTAPVFTSTAGNSRLPQYAQGGTVDIYLFHGDSGQQVLSRLDYPNPTDRAGDITALVNDTWWGDRGGDWNGQNISYLFYWVITPGGQSLGANGLPQATFTAVRKSFLLMTIFPSACPYFRPPRLVLFSKLTEGCHCRDDIC